jgi:glycosyltransferase involved in cell wall biosynthesis
MNLIWRSRLSVWDGYGRASLTLAEDLMERGWRISFDATVAPPDESHAPLPDWVRDRIVVPRDGRLTLQFLDPSFKLPPRRPTVVFTMWESAGLKPLWVRRLSEAATILVPSLFNAVSFSAAFAGAGLSCPALGVVPLGVNLEAFTPGEPRPRRPYDSFTVGMAGRMLHGGIRKGIVEGIQAFRKAFAGRTDVRLRVKALEDDPVPDFGDPRVIIDRGYWSDSELADWYRDLDVFLSPSMGEGWGLHLLEAMACGVPLITVLWSAERDFAPSEGCLALDCTLRPGVEVYTDQGVMAAPTTASLVEQLRAAFDRRDELPAMGAVCARAARDYSWDHAADRLDLALRQAIARAESA